MDFPIGEHENEFKWRLKLALIRKGDNVSDYFQLSVHQVERLYFRGKAKITCAIMNHEETQQRKLCNLGSDKTVCFEPFIYCSKLFNADNNYLPHDKLTISCQVRLITDAACTCGKMNPIKVPDTKVAEDFGKLFDNEQYSDVRVSSNGHEIYAHKNILSARSQFFEAMFQTDQHSQNRVMLDDVDPQVLNDLLRFIYTDQAPNLDNLAKQLLQAAEKFKLPKLKALCEKSLFKQLCIDNAAETLILADQLNALQLKARAIEYINRNMDKVKGTEGWHNLARNNNQLVNDHFVIVGNYSNKANYSKYSCEKCG
ncbi:protein roadkill-like [Drosophila navojoa]|nr:protein roadkill-like [Drosophila navojoa]